MMSLIPLATIQASAALDDAAPLRHGVAPTLDDLDYALKRADEEAIAEARSGDPIVSERHREMAFFYSIRAIELIEKRDSNSVPMLQTPD